MPLKPVIAIAALGGAFAPLEAKADVDAAEAPAPALKERRIEKSGVSGVIRAVLLTPSW
jgi:hypothetical protein